MSKFMKRFGCEKIELEKGKVMMREEFILCVREGRLMNIPGKCHVNHEYSKFKPILYLVFETLKKYTKMNGQQQVDSDMNSPKQLLKEYLKRRKLIISKIFNPETIYGDSNELVYAFFAVYSGVKEDDLVDFIKTQFPMVEERNLPKIETFYESSFIFFRPQQDDVTTELQWSATLRQIICSAPEIITNQKDGNDLLNFLLMKCNKKLSISVASLLFQHLDYFDNVQVLKEAFIRNGHFHNDGENYLDEIGEYELAVQFIHFVSDIIPFEEYKCDYFIMSLSYKPELFAKFLLECPSYKVEETNFKRLYFNNNFINLIELFRKHGIKHDVKTLLHKIIGWQDGIYSQEDTNLINYVMQRENLDIYEINSEFKFFSNFVRGFLNRCESANKMEEAIDDLFDEGYIDLERIFNSDETLKSVVNDFALSTFQKFKFNDQDFNRINTKFKPYLFSPNELASMNEQ